MFDKSGAALKLLKTDVLQLNMPMLSSKYPNRFFDVVLSTNQAQFLEANRGSKTTGIDIDSKGNVKGTVNLVLKMKASPKGMSDSVSNL